MNFRNRLDLQLGGRNITDRVNRRPQMGINPVRQKGRGACSSTVTVKPFTGIDVVETHERKDRPQAECRLELPSSPKNISQQVDILRSQSQMNKARKRKAKNLTGRGSVFGRPRIAPLPEEPRARQIAVLEHQLNAMEILNEFGEPIDHVRAIQLRGQIGALRRELAEEERADTDDEADVDDIKLGFGQTGGRQKNTRKSKALEQLDEQFHGLQAQAQARARAQAQERAQERAQAIQNLRDRSATIFFNGRETEAHVRDDIDELRLIALELETIGAGALAIGVRNSIDEIGIN